jgi:uncharacterized protein (TIGR00288 family)
MIRVRRQMASESTRGGESGIAVYVDFENLALGVQDTKAGRFEIEIVLKRILEKGRIVAKRAYCDWSRYRQFMQEFHRQGFEMIDIPQTKVSGKNSADIRMVVDALDMCYSKSHIDTFVLLTGDSDFSPLVSKLKENDKRVIGCGVRNSTSDLLASNCDEFIFYDDLVTVSQRPRTRAKPSKNKQQSEALDQVAADGGVAVGRVRSTVGFSGEANRAARLSGLQRNHLRVSEFFRAAGRCGEAGHAGA